MKILKKETIAYVASDGKIFEGDEGGYAAERCSAYEREKEAFSLIQGIKKRRVVSINHNRECAYYLKNEDDGELLFQFLNFNGKLMPMRFYGGEGWYITEYHNDNINPPCYTVTPLKDYKTWWKGFLDQFDEE